MTWIETLGDPIPICDSIIESIEKTVSFRSRSDSGLTQNRITPQRVC